MDYYQFHMELIGTQECIPDRGIKPDPLLKIKIAQCSTKYEHNIVPGVILQPIGGEDAVIGEVVILFHVHRIF